MSIWRCAEEIARNAVSSVEASELVQLLREQHYRCAVTGMELTPATATLEHINPMDVHNITNLRWVHADSRSEQK